MLVTWNPDDKSTSITLSNGNLTASGGKIGWGSVRATRGVSSGKYYWELIPQVSVNANFVGVSTILHNVETVFCGDAYGWGYYGNDGRKVHNNVMEAYGAVIVANDVIGVALDMDNGTITFYKNGVSQGQAYSGITGTLYATAAFHVSGGLVANFGATAFVYTPPSGYVAYNSEHPESSLFTFHG